MMALWQLGCIECLQLPVIADTEGIQRVGMQNLARIYAIKQHDQRFASWMNQQIAAPDLRRAYLASVQSLIQGLGVAGSSLGGVLMPIAMSKMLVHTNLGFGWTVRILGLPHREVSGTQLWNSISARSKVRTRLFLTYIVVKASMPRR